MPMPGMPVAGRQPRRPHGVRRAQVHFSKWIKSYAFRALCCCLIYACMLLLRCEAVSTNLGLEMMIDESSAASPHVDCRKPFGEVHHVVRRSDPQLAGSSEDASLIGRGSMNIEHVERMRRGAPCTCNAAGNGAAGAQCRRDISATCAEGMRFYHPPKLFGLRPCPSLKANGVEHVVVSVCPKNGRRPGHC